MCTQCRFIRKVCLKIYHWLVGRIYANRRLFDFQFTCIFPIKATAGRCAAASQLSLYHFFFVFAWWIDNWRVISTKTRQGGSLKKKECVNGNYCSMVASIKIFTSLPDARFKGKNWKAGRSETLFFFYKSAVWLIAKPFSPWKCCWMPQKTELKVWAQKFPFNRFVIWIDCHGYTCMHTCIYLLVCTYALYNIFAQVCMYVCINTNIQ